MTWREAIARFRDWLTRFDSPEAAFRRKLLERPRLDDESFCGGFYDGDALTLDTALVVRRVMAEQLGDHYLRVRPDDNVAEGEPDLDFYEIFLEIGEELDIGVPDIDVEEFGGTFDSIVRFVIRWRRAAESR